MFTNTVVPQASSGLNPHDEELKRRQAEQSPKKRARSSLFPPLAGPSTQLTFTEVCSLDDVATALFPVIDCHGLCSLSTASRRWSDQAMGWRAAYAFRYGTSHFNNQQWILAQGRWKTLYFREHFFRIVPGERALGLKLTETIST